MAARIRVRMLWKQWQKVAADDPVTIYVGVTMWISHIAESESARRGLLSGQLTDLTRRRKVAMKIYDRER